MALVFAALAALFVGLRFLLVPSSFGKYGHYRADAIEDVKGIEPKYASGVAACEACHPDVVKAKAASRHARLACEACHGPAAKHAEDPSSTKPMRPKGRDLCALCHKRNAGRPKGMPQVDFEKHNVGMDCFLCHDAHNPGAKEKR